jgi:hypothetical protein
MDETLMHSNERPDMSADHTLSVKFPTGELIDVFKNVNCRLGYLLDHISGNF